MKRLLSIMLAAVLALSIVGSWRAEELNRTAKDFAGEVTVVITIDNDKIVAVTAKGESEMFVTDNYALEELPDSIVEDESVDVDAIAGSTVAGNAVKTAASNARPRLPIAMSRGKERRSKSLPLKWQMLSSVWTLSAWVTLDLARMIKVCRCTALIRLLRETCLTWKTVF